MSNKEKCDSCESILPKNEIHIPVTFPDAIGFKCYVHDKKEFTESSFRLGRAMCIEEPKDDEEGKE